MLDDGSLRQNPTPIPYIGEDDTVRAGDTVSGLTGVIDHGPISSSSSVRDYRLHPTVTPSITRVNERTDAPADVGGDLTVASFNVLNYFTTLGDAGRGATNAEEFTRQQDKLFSALAAVDGDVVGLIEVENNPVPGALQNLVAGLNAHVGEPGRYAAVPDPESGVGDDAIKVALIYQPARVQPVGPSSSYVGPEFDIARPPVAQTFAQVGSGEKATVVVNHFKSKNCDPAPTGGDVDSGDGQGCYNATRTAQAQALAGFVADLAASSKDPDVLVVGDLNAYSEEDPLLTLEAAGLVDQLERFAGKAGYSYVFDGQSGSLDHALATPSLVSQVTGATEWHINADEPSVLDYNTEFKPQDLYTPTPYRSSDHDPLVVGLDLGGCRFTEDPVRRVRTLVADCTTDATIEIRSGWTLDGDGHTVTAYGGLTGAVVASDGSTAYVRDLTVGVAELTGECREVAGIAFDGASGLVTGSVVDDLVGPGEGCAAGVGVDVVGPADGRSFVLVADNEIDGSGAAGVRARGRVGATVVANDISGSPCGIEIVRPALVLQVFNTFADNGRDVCRTS